MDQNETSKMKYSGFPQKLKFALHVKRITEFLEI